MCLLLWEKSCYTAESNNQKLPHEILIKLVVGVEQQQTAPKQFPQDREIQVRCTLESAFHHPENHETGGKMSKYEEKRERNFIHKT